MRYERQSLLDHLFARRGASQQRPPVPDAWAPPWRPRGRWWLHPHLPRGYAGVASHAARGWRQAMRQPRAC